MPADSLQMELSLLGKKPDNDVAEPIGADTLGRLGCGNVYSQCTADERAGPNTTSGHLG